MSTLHTVNKSPFTHSTLASCLRIARPGDSILLVEDGVYAAAGDHVHRGQLQAAINAGIRVYVLAPDVQQRHVQAPLPAAVEQVDYTGFVTLTTTHQRIQSWYA